MPEQQLATFFRSAKAQEPTAPRPLSSFFRPARSGETAQKPVQKQAVSNWERILLQNVGSNDPQARADWLKARDYEAVPLPSGQVATRKRGEQEWGVIDEEHGSFMDILDIGDEVAFGLAVGAGGTAGAPAGLLGAAGTAAVAGGTAESVKKALGAMAGFHETPGQILKDVAVSGAIGGALDLGLRGAGRGLKHLFRKARPLKATPKAPPEAVPPQGPRPGSPAAAEVELPTPPSTPRPPGQPPPPGRPSPPHPATPRHTPPPGAPPPGGRPRTPMVRHTLEMEEGGIRETMEQVVKPAEYVKPQLTPTEAQGLVVGRPSEVVGLVDPAPGEAVYITFLKKAKRLTKKEIKEGKTPEPREVRTMRVHGNARHPAWLSEAEVAQQTKEMPLSMLRELVAEHGSAPGIIKKTYGTNKPAELEHEALTKWLFEKQPGVVTGRLGPPGTRTAENRANQLFQFWEQFSEHTPAESAAKSARTMLRNVIPGRKEYGGYRRGAEEGVLELRVGDRVYHFGSEGKPRLIQGQPKSPSTTAPPEYPIAGQKPKAEPTLLGAAKGAKKIFSTIKGATRWTRTGLLIRGAKAAVKLAAKKTPGLYAHASEGVKRAMATVARILETRGREAALTAAYSISQENKEFQRWLESQKESPSIARQNGN